MHIEPAFFTSLAVEVADSNRIELIPQFKLDALGFVPQPKLLEVGLEICVVDRLPIAQASASNLKDSEDRIQVACAGLNQLDAIATRDTLSDAENFLRLKLRR